MRLSGTPVVDICAALATPQSNLGAIVVDYGAGTQVTRTGEGIANRPPDRDCWATSSTQRELGRARSIDHGACS